MNDSFTKVSASELLQRIRASRQHLFDYRKRKWDEVVQRSLERAARIKRFLPFWHIPTRSEVIEKLRASKNFNPDDIGIYKEDRLDKLGYLATNSADGFVYLTVEDNDLL